MLHLTFHHSDVVAPHISPLRRRCTSHFVSLLCAFVAASEQRMVDNLYAAAMFGIIVYHLSGYLLWTSNAIEEVAPRASTPPSCEERSRAPRRLPLQERSAYGTCAPHSAWPAVSLRCTGLRPIAHPSTEIGEQQQPPQHHSTTTPTTAERPAPYSTISHYGTTTGSPLGPSPPPPLARRRSPRSGAFVLASIRTRWLAFCSATR